MVKEINDLIKCRRNAKRLSKLNGSPQVHEIYIRSQRESKKKIGVRIKKKLENRIFQILRKSLKNSSNIFGARKISKIVLARYQLKMAPYQTTIKKGFLIQSLPSEIPQIYHKHKRYFL